MNKIVTVLCVCVCGLFMQAGGRGLESLNVDHSSCVRIFIQQYLTRVLLYADN